MLKFYFLNAYKMPNYLYFCIECTDRVVPADIVFAVNDATSLTSWLWLPNLPLISKTAVTNKPSR